MQMKLSDEKLVSNEIEYSQLHTSNAEKNILIEKLKKELRTQLSVNTKLLKLRENSENEKEKLKDLEKKLAEVTKELAQYKGLEK